MNVERLLAQSERIGERPIGPAADRRLWTVRVLVWLGVTAAALVFYRVVSPWVWRCAAFAALYSALSLILPPQKKGTRVASLIDLAVDLVSATVVIALTGGFSSPFGALYFITTGEGFALFGTPGAVWTALSAAALSLVHLREGVDSHAALAYGFATGLLLLSALLLGVAERAAETRRGATVLKTRTMEDVERQVEALEEQNRQLRMAQREMAAAARQQKARMEDLATAQRIMADSMEEGEAETLYGRILDRLMETFGASSAALWRADPTGDQMRVCASAGQVAPNLREEPIPITEAMQPHDIRRACEGRLSAAGPAAPAIQTPRTRETEDILDLVPEEEGPPLLSALLRTEERLIGVCALSGPSEGRFAPGDAARLNTFAAVVALSMTNIEQRARLHRNLRELALLHEMSSLVQSTTDLERLYEMIVEQVGKIVRYENCTIFVFDSVEKRLIARATRGQVVNLIDHIPFEHGSGISGWVAQQRKQIFIADLLKERGLLNVELIPPRVRSFISVPMMSQESVVGVLNVSHAQPHAFTPEDVRVLAILASQAASAMERGEKLRSLEQMAITDGLTGVYNHRYFRMRLGQELKRALRYHQEVALMMLDIDHFKAINDRYGHSIGDTVLKALASVLREKMRATEIIARYGGEEFAIILPQTGVAEAMVAAERLRNAIAARSFRSADGVAFTVTISIGVAGFPHHADTPESLVEKADAALYAAKRTGRNRVCAA